jgi:hypothetical protein
LSTGWRRTFPWLPGAPKVTGSGAIRQRGGGFANTGIFIGDVIVGPRAYQILGLPPAASDLPAGFSPSQLLSADHRVVKFWGRADDLRRLAEWRDNPERGHAVLLVHGPGGQGKTRLVSEFAERTRRESSFQVMIVRPKSFGADKPDSGGVADGNDLLILVDYAERWIVEDLLAVLTDGRFARNGRRIRVLLVARAAGLWWQSLRHMLAKIGFGADAMALGPIAAGPDDRAELFAEAAAAFSSLLPGADASAVLRPDLGAPEYGLVLTVHMAALAAVDATRHPTLGGPTGVADLSAYLLDREVAHWGGLQQSGAVKISPAMMARTVFTAILVGALPYAAAINALSAVGITDDPATAGPILDDHAVCYPSGEQTSLEPLYPDRLAEDFLALQIPGHGLVSYAPQPWAIPAARSLILGAGKAPWPSRVLETVVETGQRWPHVVTVLLNPIINDRPEPVALLLKSATLASISSLPAVDVPALDAVYEALPHDSHLSINLGLAALATRIADHRMASATNPYEVADALNLLGHRLFNAGQFAHGVDAATRAAAAYREAAAARLPGAVSALGMALSNLATALYSTRHFEQALPVAFEAVATLRDVVAQNGTIESRRLLGGALLTYGDVLAMLERWDEALAAVDESQLLFHAIFEESDALGDTVYVAKALVSIGAILRNLGRPEDAVEATEDAIRHCILLSTYNAHAYEPMLASAYHNLSVQLQDLDDPAQLPDALRLSYESVSRWRDIVNESDSAQQYAINFLNALANLMHLAAGANQLELAIAAGEELLVRSHQLAHGDQELIKLSLRTNARLYGLRRLREQAGSTPPAQDLGRPRVGGVSTGDPADAVDQGSVDADDGQLPRNGVGRAVGGPGQVEEEDASRRSVSEQPPAGEPDP